METLLEDPTPLALAGQVLSGGLGHAAEAVLHHLPRLLGKVVGRKILRRDERHRLGVRPRPCVAGHVVAQVVDDHVVIADAAVLAEDAVEHGHDLAGPDDEARLLLDLPHQGLLERLAELHRPPGHHPAAAQRLLAPADQQDPALVDDDRADADLRLEGAAAHQRSCGASSPARTGGGGPLRRRNIPATYSAGPESQYRLAMASSTQAGCRATTSSSSAMPRTAV